MIENCHLCNSRLTASQNEMLEENTVILICGNEDCCADHKSKVKEENKFVLSVDLKTDQIITYWVDVKINDKEYCVISYNHIDYKEPQYNEKVTKIHKWLFDGKWDLASDLCNCGKETCDVCCTMEIDYDPMVEIKEYFPPDGTKEFYTDLVKRLLNIKVFL